MISKCSFTLWTVSSSWVELFLANTFSVSKAKSTLVFSNTKVFSMFWSKAKTNLLSTPNFNRNYAIPLSSSENSEFLLFSIPWGVWGFLLGVVVDCTFEIECKLGWEIENLDGTDDLGVDISFNSTSFQK